MKGLEIEAVYENGTLKLPRELPLQEGQKVTITIHPPGWMCCSAANSGLSSANSAGCKALSQGIQRVIGPLTWCSVSR